VQGPAVSERVIIEVQVFELIAVDNLCNDPAPAA
jgi:hypothetical protein